MQLSCSGWMDDIFGTHRVAGFSMRVLADYLDTYPATLYWHVGGRGALISAVVDRVLAEIVVPDLRTMAWDEWLRELAVEYRRALHRHPNVGQLVASELSAGAVAARLVELILEALESAGFRGPGSPRPITSTWVRSPVGFRSSSRARRSTQMPTGVRPSKRRCAPSIRRVSRPCSGTTTTWRAR